MAGYDPKAKRAHSASATAGHAPVDDLLGSPTATPRPGPESPPPPQPPRSTPNPRPPAPLTPTPAPSGPDPKVLVALLVGAVTAVVLWRHRRRT